MAALALLVVGVAFVARTNIEAQGMATGFGFLARTTGWPVSFSLIEVGPRSTYARVLLAGLLNTMLVGFLAVALATVLGFVLAFMRLTSNTLIRFLGTTYVEVFRNVPVILQVFFWYAVLTHLPGPRQALSLGDAVFLSNRGLMLPVPALGAGGWLVLVLFAAAAAVSVRLLRRRPWMAVLAPAGTAAALAGCLVLAGLLPDPLFSVPELKGLRFVGGVVLKPEFTALLVGLTLFGSAYIGEIIRGGLLSVDRGKLDAGAALGLSRFQVSRFIRIPLALRAMLPALANQYVWLMKATTVGIAIGFPDYFAIVSTSINQAGNTLELLALLMLGFLAVNYALAFAMNLLNARLKLKGGV